MNVRETSTAYERPYRPRAIRLLDALGRAAERAGLAVPLSAPALMRAARRRDRLEDFGAPSLSEPLSRLVDALEAEAALTPVGRLLTRERLIGLLGNRLRARAWLTKQPAIAAQPVARPIIITGLQRSGTTLLQRLLGAGPAIRALASWEALNPAPPLDIARRRVDPRLGQARRSEAALRYLAPDFFAIHPVQAEAPEEDSLLLDLSLYSPVAEATWRVPSYAAWLARQDMQPAYALLADMLRLLQHQRPAARWVLKSPAHLPFIDVLLRTFDDAIIVQTHRDPRATLPSYCSMIAHGRGVFSDRIDARALGREMLRQQSAMLLSAMAARRAAAAVEARVLDVDYDEIVAAPLAVVQRIYRFAGLPFDAAAQAAAAEVLATQTQHRFGRHVYALEDFGLDVEQVETAFGRYLAQRPTAARAEHRR